MPRPHTLSDAPAPLMADHPTARRPIETGRRHLRHQTQDVVHHVLGCVLNTRGLLDTMPGKRLARDLERRIRLSGVISNVLFDFASTSAPIDERLRELCRSMIALFADPVQTIRLEIAIEGACPAELEETLGRIVCELIANAIQHGMYMRLLGRLVVRLVTREGATLLSVADDGWGFSGDVNQGGGFRVVEGLARAWRGHVAQRRGHLTTVEVDLRHPDPG